MTFFSTNNYKELMCCRCSILYRCLANSCWLWGLCWKSRCVERRLQVDEHMTAGRCNVYYHSVKGGVTFHSTQGIGFLFETGSSTVAIFDVFEQHVRNQKYYMYTPVEEGRKVDMVLIGTGKGNATTWQWKPTGIAVASRGSLRQHGFLVSLYLHLVLLISWVSFSFVSW